MADDQKPKTMDINDLVRELSKSSTGPVSPTPRPPMTPPMTGAKYFIPTPAPTPTKPPEMPRPQFNAPPQSFTRPSQPMASQPSKTVPVPPVAAPLPPPGVKEYQSSIRTMNEDISRIKQGQQPAGIPFPRKVEQASPAPQTIPPKPVMPSPQFKIPSVNLGEAQKTGPLAQSKDFSKPSETQKTEPKPQIYIPQEGQKMGNRNMLFLGIGAVALVAGFSYWFFVLRSPVSEVVTETPSPTPIATPVQNLNSIFSGISTENVSVKDPVVDLNTIIKTLPINGGEFKNLNVTSELKGQFALGLLDFIAKPMQQLVDNMGTDFKVLLYGQKEIFDSNGQIKTSAMVEKRLVFVNEIKDMMVALQLGKDWEINMNEDLKLIFDFDPKKQESNAFADNSYRGVNIKYKNFKYADRSIDYAIVPASNQKSYLVIAGSREAMYSAIDKLKGF